MGSSRRRFAAVAVLIILLASGSFFLFSFLKLPVPCGSWQDKSSSCRFFPLYS